MTRSLRLREAMVHPSEMKDNPRQQERASAHDPSIGRPPLANEIVGGHTTPPFEAAGIDAFAPLLGHVSFPATKADVIARIGHAIVPVDVVTTMRVEDIVALTAPETFRDADALLSAVKRVWPRIQPHYEGGRGAHHQG